MMIIMIDKSTVNVVFVYDYCIVNVISVISVIGYFIVNVVSLICHNH